MGLLNIPSSAVDTRAQRQKRKKKNKVCSLVSFFPHAAPCVRMSSAPRFVVGGAEELVGSGGHYRRKDGWSLCGWIPGFLRHGINHVWLVSFPANDKNRCKTKPEQNAQNSPLIGLIGDAPIRRLLENKRWAVSMRFDNFLVLMKSPQGKWQSMQP